MRVLTHFPMRDRPQEGSGDGAEPLLDGDGLGQVTGLVHVPVSQ